MTAAGERTRLEIGDDGVAVVTLAHPPLNIYDLAMRDELLEWFTSLGQHPDVNAVVLAAEGPHFSAGADLAEFGTAPNVMAARRIRWDRDPWTPLWELPQPTVAALHGYALGAGLEMALLCDLRLVAPSTNIGLPETKLGMLPSAGGSQSLARLLGSGPALPIVLLAETLSAHDALHRGIVDRIIDDLDVTEAARTLAATIAAAPAHAMRAARRALRASADLPLAEGLRRERLLATTLARRSFHVEQESE